ncbi:MAG TPA: glycosyltransferase family 2 protein [Rhodospirillaceae bacterium]|nr:glycosyltransferase family 2 protein [Rhodospirillaceae bacterium]
MPPTPYGRRRRRATSLSEALSNAVHLVGRGLRYYRAHGFKATLRKITGLPGYRVWWRLYGRLRPDDRDAIQAALPKLALRPLISVVMPVYNPADILLRRAILSVREQIYPHWELCVVDDGSNDPLVIETLAELAASDARIKLHYRPANGGIVAATNQALSMASGDFVAFMDHDDEIPPEALFVLAKAIIDHPDAALIYSDEDKIDLGGHHFDPYFKPDWNEDFFYSQNFINHLCAVRRSLLTELEGLRPGFEGGQDYDLVLRVVERLRPSQILHIPRVLYHWRQLSSSFSHVSLSAATDSARRAVTEHLARRAIKATVTPITEDDRYQRVRYPLPDPAPRVSLIIPTRDRVELLRQCVDGLLDGTDYPDYEIIIVDNDSQHPASHAYFAQLKRRGVRVLHHGGPFNYPALNNGAVAQASGDLICLLNNDIKIIHADWLREMASQACRPEVGAVGAKLYYADGTIQHVGVVIGMGGIAGHINQFLPRQELGNHQDVNLVREVSCVTAACLLLRKEVFAEVGGLDEALAVAFNDVDFCLRIREKGYRIIWTPFAELYHLESASRGSDLTAEQLARCRREEQFMRDRWGQALLRDPFYNPNLTLESPRGGLAFPPRLPKPWES